jgi:hypothetical protein
LCVPQKFPCLSIKYYFYILPKIEVEDCIVTGKRK